MLKQLIIWGGINTVGETLTFQTNHNFDDGEEIIYNNLMEMFLLGINTWENWNFPFTETLSNNQGSYFAKSFK